VRALRLAGIFRNKGTLSTIPAKDGIGAGNLLNRDFIAPKPDHTWVMDFTCRRTWKTGEPKSQSSSVDSRNAS